MNERIHELIRLSTVPADRAEDYALAKGLIEPTEKLDVAKFAELIAAECINMIEAEAKNADEDDVHGMRNAAGLIGRAFITFK